MAEVVIDLAITMLTPLSVGAGGSSGTVADNSILRDGWGRPIIPASQVKGKTRHTAEALARTLGLTVAESLDQLDDTCVIQPIFGAPGKRSSPLRFNDLPLVEPGIDPAKLRSRDVTGLRAGRIRPSVSINRHRGVAEDERLLFQETTSESTVFRNERAIVGTLDDERDLALLLAALRLTTRWGGGKSRGLGWAHVEAVARWDETPFDDPALEVALRKWE